MADFKLKQLVACLTGNTVEWFDYATYGLLATFLAGNFFPPKDAHNLIFTYAIFAVGFFIRPLGGVFMAAFADKKGRRGIFSASVLMMAIPGLLTACLPSYSVIGEWAILALIILRVMQGLGVGGEYPVVVTYLAELTEDSRKGMILSLISATIALGALAATLFVFLLRTVLGDADFGAWGWRIPFLVSFVAPLISYKVRSKLPETLVNNEGISKIFKTLCIRSNVIIILKVMGCTIGISVGYYLFNVFSSSYLQIVSGFSLLATTLINGLSILFMMVVCVISGILSDKKGIDFVGKIAISLTILFALPIYLGMTSKSFYIFISAQIVFSFIIGFYLGVLPALLYKRVEPTHRCTALSIGYNLSSAIFGGTAPLISDELIRVSGSVVAPGFYLLFAALVSFFSLIYL